MTVTELPGQRPAAGPRPLALAVVCGSPVIRSGLEQVLASAPFVTVAHSVDSLPALAGRGAPPDLAVIDLYALRSAGISAAFWAALPAGCQAVLLCRPEDPPDLVTALRGGARAFLTREAGVEELLSAVRTARSGGIHLSPDLARHLIAQATDSGADRQPLARREIETLRWVAEGLTHGQISRRMGLTEATVSTYVKRIRTKLNAGNKADLTRAAIELGYVAPR
jgi:two-component system, NarL family, invasion response regulator UvrY